MSSRSSLVITSIASQQLPSLKSIARQCLSNKMPLIIIGDASSPDDFQLVGSQFYSLHSQQNLSYSYAKICPERSYARKNIGYLIAISNGVTEILETDDDNIPNGDFWTKREKNLKIPLVTQKDWINVYRFFSNKTIWPRGLPLNKVNSIEPKAELPSAKTHCCPIQQGLVDGDPDVDAIYRLTSELPQTFDSGISVALGEYSWCPFNSQNTWWSEHAFPLMYLPSTCEMRLTDIWRSFVAQRVAWEFGWKIAFHSPNAKQIRNDHDLIDDLTQEKKGLLYNDDIKRELEGLKLSDRLSDIYTNVYTCYERLVQMKLLDSSELCLLKAWSTDLRNIKSYSMI